MILRSHDRRKYGEGLYLMKKASRWEVRIFVSEHIKNSLKLPPDKVEKRLS